jgi:hypothetical protein
MINLIPRLLKPKWAHLPAALTTFSNQRSWCGLMLGCLLLAGCVTSGETPSPSASDQNSLPKADPAVARAADAAPVAVPTAAAPVSPELLRRRRLAIADMLEENFYFRTIYNAKLVDAKLAGPIEYKSRAIFTGANSTATYYCASAQLETPLIPLVRTAMISVKTSSGGYERLQVSDASPLVCGDANFGSFPELEQARAQRRKTLGKAD